MKLLHTADWQLGRPYARIEDPDKRARARAARFEALDALVAIAREEAVSLVLVAGDVFDAPTVDKATVSRACRALGAFQVPVVLLPGNHDHAGAGSVWHQRFFEAERADLAPNVHVVLAPGVLELAGASIFACPLQRRAESFDTTAWLRDGEALAAAPAGQPRLVLAHGATQLFGAGERDPEGPQASNFIDLGRLPTEAYDYVALGDWHGTKQVGPKAWYAGTHEPDRFPRGEAYDAGNALVVEVARGTPPAVQARKTARLRWHALAHAVHGDAELPALEAAVGALLGEEVDRHLLTLTLTGSLGVAGMAQLETLITRLEARLVRLELDQQLTLQPSPEDLARLCERPDDPTIAAVAQTLVAQLAQPGAEAETARLALLELHRLVSLAEEG